MTELELFPHQVKALRKLSNGKILWGGVGSGKTRVAAEYYMLKGAPRDVYVITTAKKRNDFDWQQQFYELGIGPRTGPVFGPKDSSRRTPGSKSGRSSSDAGTSGRRRNAESCRLDGAGRETARLLDDRRRDVVQDSQPNGSGSGVAGDLLLKGARGRSPFGQAGVFPYVLTVDSWNNIAKYAEVSGAFFIFDEQRLVGSGNWTRKFLKIAKRNHWILLSATPGDTWMDYIPTFIANGFYKNRTEFIREHVVYNTFTKFPKVDRYINVGRLVRQRHQVLVEMPYVRHTKRRMVEVPLRYDKEMLDRVIKERWHVYEDRPLRDVGEMFIVARRVVNSDPSRLEMVCELWKQHPKLIVFYNFNFELESLRSLNEYYEISKTATGMKTKPGEHGNGRTISTSSSIDGFSETRTHSGIVLSVGSAKTSTEPRLLSRTTPGGLEGFGDVTDSQGHTIERNSSKTSPGENFSSAELVTTAISEWNGHKHQQIPSTDRWLYLVQYTAGAEGWNCVETDAMIFYSRHYSWKVWEQAQGRIDRLNSPFRDLWYYDFMTDSMIDRAIGRALKAKKIFNEARYASLLSGMKPGHSE